MPSSEEEQLVVEVTFKIDKDADGFPKSRDSEALLCKPLDAECSTCIVQSVPFYLRTVAYGDIISTQEDQSGALQFGKIVKRGGYSIYRVLLYDISQKDALISRLLDLGALLEQDGSLIALAVLPDANSSAIVDFILEGKQAGFWGAQDGYVFGGGQSTPGTGDAG